MFDRNIISKAVITALIFVAPNFASAELLVTEVAWMGTSASANDEWIEIHNSGVSAVSLSSWTLSAADGTPNITLSGTIGAGEYRLLERTDDTTYPGITALQIFTGALGNEGENLSLKNGTNTVQSMSFSGGWPAGDITTKKTMQWTGSTWVTADETGGSATTATADDDTEEEETDDEEEEIEDNEIEDEEEEEETAETETNSKGGSPSLQKTVYEDMIFELDFPSRAFAGSPAKFSAQALDLDRTKLRKGKYIFNMGDGTLRTFTRDWSGKDKEYFYHTYEHPGSYNISIRYYMTYFEDVPPEVDDTFVIEVISAPISITRVHADGAVELKNDSSSHADISEWILRDSSGRRFVIPSATNISSGKSIVITKKNHQLDTASGVTLLTQAGVYVSSPSVQPKPSVYKAVSTGAKPAPKAEIGEVLGVSVAEASVEESTAISSNEKSQNRLVWLLLFIILVLVSVIAVLLLKREEYKEEYLLVDE